MLGIWTLLAMLAVGATPQPGKIGWALAYSGYVMRNCDGWDQRLDHLPPSALPSPETLRDGVWSETGADTLAYRRGLAAAREARKADVRFCERPLRGAGDEAAAVDRLLVRIAPTP